MEQRDEENQQEIAKLRAEIKNLKLELFQLKSKFDIGLDKMFNIFNKYFPLR